jgi:ABC-type transport system involved in cytochrome bd biosynthesis fused ATPase/permease subunit
MQSLFAAFNGLANIFTDVVQSVGAAEKVFQWIERKPKCPLGETQLQNVEGDLEIRGVDFL